MIVAVEVFPVAAAGSKVAVIPAGGASSARFTVPVKLVRAIATVVCEFPPALMVSVAGAAVSV